MLLFLTQLQQEFGKWNARRYWCYLHHAPFLTHAELFSVADAFHMWIRTQLSSSPLDMLISFDVMLLLLLWNNLQWGRASWAERRFHFAKEKKDKSVVSSCLVSKDSFPPSITLIIPPLEDTKQYSSSDGPTWGVRLGVWLCLRAWLHNNSNRMSKYYGTIPLMLK